MDVSAINVYLDTSLGPEAHLDAVNSIIDSILDDSGTPILSVIVALQPQLTGADDRPRGRAAMLLAELINSGMLMLDTPAVHSLVEFFTARVSDYPSLPASLSGLQALCTLNLASFDHSASAGDVRLIVDALFRTLSIQDLAQSARARCFSILAAMVADGTTVTKGDCSLHLQP